MSTATRIFLFSCLVSIVFLSFFKNVGPAGHRVPGGDYLDCYAPMAENMMAGKEVVAANGFVRCPPGYPLLLIPIFFVSDMFGLDRLAVITFFNVVVAALAAVLVFLIARQMFSGPIAVVAAVLWITYPFNQWLIKNPNTEVPFIAILLLGTWLFFISLERKNTYLLFGAGMLLGFAALVRPIGLLIPFALAVAIIILYKEFPQRTKILFCSLIILGSVMAVAPWELYVFSKTGKILPLSGIGPIELRASFSFAAKPGEGGQQFKGSPQAMQLMREIDASPIQDQTSYREAFAVLWTGIKKYPLAFAEILLVKVVRSWYATSQMWLEYAILAMQLPYLGLAVAGIKLAFRQYQGNRNLLIIGLGIIGYFWAMTTVNFSIVRYILPAVPFVVMFSALALHKFYKKWIP